MAPYPRTRTKDTDSLIVYETPELNQPALIAAFGGWPNAGEVATGALSYLKNKLKAKRFAEISPEDFYNFTSLRPITVIQEGHIKGLRFPSNEFLSWKNEKSSPDLILLLGTEPHLRWGKYVDAVLKVAQQFGVARVYTLGGTYDRIPHTREPRVSAVANDSALTEELRQKGIYLTSYQGPSSLHTTLLAACGRRHIKAISLWGHTPHYIQATWNPGISCAVLMRLIDLLGIEFDLEDLRKTSEYVSEVINKVMRQNPELQQYVAKLEEDYEALGKIPPEPTPLEEKDKIIQDLEEFLKGEQKRGDGDKSG